MDDAEHRAKREEDDRSALLQGANNLRLPFASHPPNGFDPSDSMRGIPTNIMVAGQRTGKTSFLRLLLETSDISPLATKDQVASVAKFVHGSTGHTPHIRVAAIDINVDIEGHGAQQRLALTLVDTPSLNFEDPSSSERMVQDMLRHIDSRFAEGIDDEWQNGDQHIHLCIYFLDPDQIVPPSVPGPPAPLVPRARTNSFSQLEAERVILEPPIATNPSLCRPTLPAEEINTIRRLSARVNVLPVIAHADTLSNDRLAAVKMAIRRDLAEAGIGFGIFDVDNPLYQQVKDEQLPKGEPTNGHSAQHIHNGAVTSSSPPTSPVLSPLLRLPYALISPDTYSHSDGVPRTPLSRHELTLHYTPPGHHGIPTSKLVRGQFIRSYRWGFLDVLDPNHSDFLPLRTAIFYHMETLRKYTREYLYDKFRNEYRSQQRPPHPAMQHHMAQGIPHLSVTHASRPILAIDTAPHHPVNRHPSLSVPRDMTLREHRSTRTIHDQLLPSASGKLATSSSGLRFAKQRTKKITVACNFCRSRKLKCDGGRPACSQCVKRSNSCDYMPQTKRRGNVRQRRGVDDSESESGEDRSVEFDEPSVSPDIPSQPLSRRSSNVEKPNQEDFASSLGAPIERREELLPPPPPQLLQLKPQSQPQASSSRSKPLVSPVEARNYYDNELPHIATLSLPEPSPSSPMSAPTLPPIRPASDQQAAQRKRAATVPGKSVRQPSNSGPKVVACNFCRARKTKCDGAHPACASCARRSLPCNYVHDSTTSASGGPVQKKGSRRASTSKAPTDSSHSHSPPSSRMAPTPSSANANDAHDIHFVQNHEGEVVESEIDLKRAMEDSDAGRPLKKIRMEDNLTTGIP